MSTIRKLHIEVDEIDEPVDMVKKISASIEVVIHIFKRLHPRIYNAEKDTIEEILRNKEKLAQEAIKFFEENPNKRAYRAAAIYNPYAWSRRDHLYLVIKRDGKVRIIKDK